jgi:GT2 family glycosyltransferase
VSVVIPTFHRDDPLALCLDSLVAGQQRHATLVPADGSDAARVEAIAGAARQYEVIVTDAGTKSTSAEMVHRRFPWVRWIARAGAGPAANRNSGARAARGEWLIFVDDDCVPEPGFVAAIMDCAERVQVDVIEGRIVVRGKVDSPWRRQPENPRGGLFWTGNLAIRRETFLRLGGFDEDFVQACEDMDFGHRIRTGRLRTAFCPEAIVWHPSQRQSFRDLVHRTTLQRWHLLYRLKSGISAPLGCSRTTALADLVWMEFTNRLRTSWHLVSRHDPEQWKSNLFAQLWSWLTFPVVLPYLMLWELRFRTMLRTRSAHAGCAPPEAG